MEQKHRRTTSRRLSRRTAPYIEEPVIKNNLPVTKNNNNKFNGNGLTPNQKMFADEWLKDRNGVRSYTMAYPNVKNWQTAGVMAHHLLKNTKVSAYISERLELISQNAQIDQEGVIKRYMMLLDYKISDFFYDSGEMKPLSEIPEDKVYAIMGLKHSKKTMITPDHVIIENFIKDFKLANKVDVLNALARHLGMFAKDNEQQRGGQGNSINFNEPVQININMEGPD